MSDFLDDLAREMAEPMTRSRALKVFGGAVVAAAVPGILGATPAWGRRRSRGTRVRGTRCEFGNPNIPCGPNTCCDTGDFCADPSIGACCTQGGSLCKSSGHAPTCCEPGETCNSALGGCCPAGSAVCGESCCFDREVCGNAKESLCCPPDVEPCGTVCCPKGETCAGAGKGCCKKGEDPCEGPRGKVTCCDAKHACCEGECCPKGRVCRHGKCKRCPRGTKPCGDTDCCPDASPCCGAHCCLNGECVISRGEKVCCPSGRVTTSRGRRFCCPEGLVPKHGTCCPETGPCDCGDGIACLPGTYCDDGKCVRI